MFLIPILWLQTTEKSSRRATEKRPERNGGSARGPLAEDKVVWVSPARVKRRKGGAERKKKHERKKASWNKKAKVI